MIPYEIDPSLHDHEPAPARLEDGFSAPAPQPPAPALDMPHEAAESSPSAAPERG